jgi:hypothetical protein
MGLIVLGGPLAPNSQVYNQLNLFCLNHSLEATLEWHSGQYWLHSDDPKELPIGISVDRELERHVEYFKQVSLLKELSARAVGVKSGIRPKILDLTGGLLGDTLLFLSFGCEVTTLERHPIISFLIQSALANASHAALSRLAFYPSDALSFLEQETTQFDVIYFDPMFEDASQKSAPQKKMRIFRSLVGKDEDALKVFELALQSRPKRLVVKRPRHSQELSSLPMVKFAGKSTRYDVYFSNQIP